MPGVGDAAAAKPALPPGHSHRHVCGPVTPKRARCHADVVTEASGAPFISPGPAGYGPADLQSAYDLASSSATAGGSETVALVDAYDDPNAESDLGVYRSQYGLPACTTANGCFRKVDESGGTSYPSANASWSQEISLDLDMVSAVCPNCKILLVEASSNRMSDLAASVDEAAALGATQISNSYGGGEYSSEVSDQSHYDHPGIDITVSSGDNGYGPEFPAASQYVTAVGGTSLNQASNSRGWSETAWPGAGSGCSAYVSKPSWQTDTGCGNRTIADVSAVADPNTGVAVYDSYSFHGSSGWLVFGGTSVASPIVASVDALAGGRSAGNAYGSFPYSNPSLFWDVVGGSNGTCSPSYLCTAVAGYDGPTGMGTPHGTGQSTNAQPPAATSEPATSVSASGATLNGTVNPESTATTYHFEYGTSTSYGTSVPVPDQSVGSDATDHSESQPISGLQPNTTYHYRIVATNSGGTSYGSDETFTTEAIAPTATTNPATSVSATAATLNGTVNPENSATTYHFEYGTSTSYGTSAPVPDQSVGSDDTGHSESQPISGLQPNTTYHYRIVATNSVGTTYGGDQSFTTHALAPVATTTAATSVSATAATLNGTVNPENSATTYHFEYGTSTNYGTSVPAADQSAGADHVSHSESQPLTGLRPNTTYHYRVVATNEAGTAWGADGSFTTGPDPFSGAFAPKSTDKMGVKGNVRVRVVCPSGTYGQCSGKLRLNYVNNGTTTTLGTASFTIAPGGSATIKVHLSSQGQALVVQHGQLKVNAVVKSHDGAGTKRRRATTITLVAP